MLNHARPCYAPSPGQVFPPELMWPLSWGTQQDEVRARPRKDATRERFSLAWTLLYRGRKPAQSSRVPLNPAWSGSILDLAQSSSM
eukprot:3001791-Pyramimonas_sp.AAC.1